MERGRALKKDMEMRPNIEEFVKTLRGKKAAFVPTAELGVHPKIKEQFLGRALQNMKDEVEFWYKAGYDYVKLQPNIDFNPNKIGLDKAKGLIEGSLAYKWATEGKGVIDSEETFEKYVFPKIEEIDYSRFEKAAKYLPDGFGIVGQYGDIFTMTWEMMGFEAFSMALFTNPDLIKALNNKIGAMVYSMFEFMAQNDKVDALWYSDDVAFSEGLLMSPDVLKYYIWPWLKKIADLAKKYNKPLIYHTDGVLWDVFDDIIDCGVDALHPIEPKAMDIKDVKEKYGDKLCLVGHVDVDLISRGTPEQVKNKVIENIEIAGYNGGYVVGSGNSIPDYANLENYTTMLDTVRNFKY